MFRHPGPQCFPIVVFFIDMGCRMGYVLYMLKGVRIFSSDNVWRHILSGLHAVLVENPDNADINFDDLKINAPLNSLELKTIIMDALDNSGVIRDVFGKNVRLPRTQSQIVVWLRRRGAMTGDELKQAMGYAPDAATHTIDTAIYQLRKTYGRDFIINTNGVYSLGHI